MADFAFVILDVFAQTAFRGNPLAIVPDADALTTSQMQAVARQFNLSETAFLMTPENPAHAARVRIFTPRYEMDFAGHPTVGAAVYLAEERLGPNTAPGASLVLEENIGPVRCWIGGMSGAWSYAAFESPRRAEAAGPDPASGACAQSLGLSDDEIGFDRHRPSLFSAGAAFVYAPLRSLDALARAKPSAGFSETTKGAVGLVAYARRPQNDPFAFQMRMFAPDAGVYEDPATGSAAAGFAGVLSRFESLPEGRSRLALLQGVEMGRRSEIRLELYVAQGEATGCQIGGHAVRTAWGRMAWPR